MLPYIKIYTEEFSELVGSMTDEQAGVLFKAMLAYARDESPDIPSDLRLVWLLVKRNIDRAADAYEIMIQHKRENGAKGGRPRKNQEVFDKTEKNQQVISKTIGFSENQEVFSKTEKSYIKEKEKDKDKEKEISLSADAERRQEELAEYARSKLVSVQHNMLKKLYEKRATMTDELIKYAIDETVRNGGGSLKYTLTVLRNWERDGVKTPADAAGRGSPAKPMITRDLGDADSDNTFDIMNRPRR